MTVLNEIPLGGRIGREIGQHQGHRRLDVGLAHDNGDLGHRHLAQGREVVDRLGAHPLFFLNKPSVPCQFGENPANMLTNAEVFDPLAKIPEFKVSAVRVAKAQAA